MNWICFVAGKTGGHILPGLTESLEEKKRGNQVIFITTTAPLDAHIMRDYPHVDAHISLIAGSRGYAGIWGKTVCIAHAVHSFFASLRLFWRYKPQRVISMGGLVSLPLCYAAWLLRIPVIVYELNAIPGKAVQALAPLATEVRVCFSQAQQFFKKSVRVEYPVRFTERDRISQAQACRILGLHQDRYTLFICGGSQGSRFINTFIMQLLAARTNVQIIHQAGAHDVGMLRAWYKAHGIEALVFAYRPDMEVCYAAAHRAIARAGAGTLFELLFFRVPALIIPLVTKTTNHQCDNAYAMNKKYPDLFMVSLQDDLDKKRESIEKFLFSVLT